MLHGSNPDKQPSVSNGLLLLVLKMNPILVNLSAMTYSEGQDDEFVIINDANKATITEE